MANQLDLAVMQFTGWFYAMSGDSAKTLAINMGLKKKEWMKIRATLPLSPFDKESIDEIFHDKTKTV